ncbi:MAG: cytochrome-c oxidase, cbb3-type subunit III [Candidatus Sedimenticola sp. (ex Thyasira tokunagai)]
MSDKNPFPGENNTGHIWDDNIRELDNPPPRWWMLAFWASMAWVLVYVVLYPAIPGITSYTKGIMGWTSIGEYKEGLDEVVAARSEYEARIKDKSAAEILADPDLKGYTLAAAKVLFGDNCAACHGSKGQGAPTFPVLVDDDWLFGGSVETVEQTITNGRKGIMTSNSKIMSGIEIDQLAQDIMAGTVTANPNFTAKGCIACHGPQGKGMHILGSANLTDKIWRFAEEDQLASIKYTITHGVNDASDSQTRQAEMPVFGNRLSKDEIKKLTVYVKDLTGGQ